MGLADKQSIEGEVRNKSTNMLFWGFSLHFFYFWAFNINTTFPFPLPTPDPPLKPSLFITDLWSFFSVTVTITFYLERGTHLRSKGNWQDSVLCLNHVGPQYWAQVIRLEQVPLPLSHFTVPRIPTKSYGINVI